MGLKRITNNRYIDALLKLMLVSAIIHVFMIITYSIVNQDLEKLNFFDIVGIGLFFDFVNSSLFIVIGLFLVILIYILFFVCSKVK